MSNVDSNAIVPFGLGIASFRPHARVHRYRNVTMIITVIFIIARPAEAMLTSI
jgi:hypothetical protein